ncbi:MAG: lamin tail domain-containing protein, partial [Planctomycetes bacterium]|nr:lamin tail domain-containing protein [Planctomycetota bacterium]
MSKTVSPALIFLIAVAAARPALSQSLLITELMASNSSALADEDGDFSDWIEIHNRGASAAALGGWSLTDSRNDLAKWTFPEMSLGAGEFLVVFASGKDRAAAGAELHTSF